MLLKFSFLIIRPPVISITGSAVIPDQESGTFSRYVMEPSSITPLLSLLLKAVVSTVLFKSIALVSSSESEIVSPFTLEIFALSEREILIL